MGKGGGTFPAQTNEGCRKHNGVKDVMKSVFGDSEADTRGLGSRMRPRLATTSNILLVV